MKTTEGMKAEFYTGRKGTKDFFRNNEKVQEFLNSDNKGKTLVIHEKGLWHCDYIIRGESNRETKADLSLDEEILLAREMERETIMNSSIPKGIKCSKESKIADDITREMAEIWGIEY